MISLYINGHLQFSEYDEYRYHEALVFPLFYYKSTVKRLLILGGGDGLAVREALKAPSIEEIILVDLDPEMTHLGQWFHPLTEINQRALNDPRVQIVNTDAYQYILDETSIFDAIIADFPDPTDESLAKLYSKEFYYLVLPRLKRDGIFITQSTSPRHAPHAFWCIHQTLSEVFPTVIPYHIPMRSLGDWGFQLAAKIELDPVKPSYNAQLNTERIWFTPERWRISQYFGWDETTQGYPLTTNTFEYPVLYTYVLMGWHNF